MQKLQDDKGSTLADNIGVEIIGSDDVVYIVPENMTTDLLSGRQK